jgi:hypothetical protein
MTADLTLFGNVVSYIPHFALVFEDIGRTGVGRKPRGRFRLEGIYADAEIVYDPTSRTLHGLDRYISEVRFDIGSTGGPHEATMEFVTPTRLSTGGRIPEELTFVAIIKAVFRRVSTLGVLYCRWDEVPSFGEMLKSGKTVILRIKSYSNP